VVRSSFARKMQVRVLPPHIEQEMDRTISFSWQVLYRADTALFGCLRESPILRLEEPNTYFNRISAKDSTLYHPIGLNPINLFHVQLRRELADGLGVTVCGTHFPYQFPIRSFNQEGRVSLSLQLFLPNLMSIRITCHDNFPFDEKTAFKDRSIDRHPDLLFMADASVKIVSKAVCSNMPFKRKKIRPIMGVHYCTSDSDFLLRDGTLLVALLINDSNYRESNEKIFKGILDANREHNSKGERSKLILINKQGYLAVTNERVKNNGLAAQEIKKRKDMFELGCVLQQFYEDYPALRQKHMREMDYLYFATRRYIKEAELAFESSFGNTLAWLVILQSLKLEESFDRAARFNVDSASKLANLFDMIPHPHYANPAFWTEVRQILGDNYMAQDTGGNKFTIGTNYGSIATGDNSTASTTNITTSDKSNVLNIIEQLAQLRGEVPVGAKREEFDEIVVMFRSEVKSEKPNTGNLQKIVGSIKSILEGVASHAIAMTLVAAAIKVLGLPGFGLPG
jgi:hypothetical protein